MELPNENSIARAGLILQIERLAKRTWPAAVYKPLGPWELRSSGGITSRANSVWTSAGNMYPQGKWSEEAERFYRSQQLPICFQISDASPAGLDHMLVEHRYTKESLSAVLIAQADEVIAKTLSETNPELKLTVYTEFDQAWLAAFLELGGFKESRKSFYETLFAGIEPLKAFFLLEAEGRCAAVGTAIVEDGWAGFVNIVVHRELRGRRIGQRLLHELAVWSRQHGAQGLYLQVEENNAPANRLYGRAGYELLYKYHYRKKAYTAAVSRS